MNILPIALTAAGAIPNIIGGIMSAVLAGKKLSGSGLARRSLKRKGAGRLHRRHHKKKMKKGKGLVHMKRQHKKMKPAKRHHKKKGKGVVADTLGNIPLLGALLGPLAKAFGGKLKRMPRRKAIIRALIHRLKGKGLSPMYIRRPYVSSGCGLVPVGNAPYSRPSMGMIHAPRIGSGLSRHSLRRKGTGRHGNTHRMSNTIKAILRGGNGLSPMYIRRPYTGSGISRRSLLHKGTGRLAPVGVNFKSPGTYLTPQLATAALTKKYPNMTVMTPYKPPIVGPGTKGIASYPIGAGLLYPAGGLVHRRGHLRKIKGKKHKVRVKPTVVGRGLLSPAGGYIPYGGHYGVYLR